jgi:hypothetical protein
MILNMYLDNIIIILLFILSKVKTKRNINLFNKKNSFCFFFNLYIKYIINNNEYNLIKSLDYIYLYIYI